MLTLFKNTRLYQPAFAGETDVLTAAGKVVAIGKNLDISSATGTTVDCRNKILTPGFIDQHTHLIGAGGKNGFASMTPEIMLSDFISCGTTTALGLLGTDASARSLKTLYAKAKALELEGISTYMHCGYFGIDPVTLTGSILEDLLFIDKIIGCKVAICDTRSSYPTETELLRHLRDVMVGGLTSGKGGILHIHLGNLDSKMDVLFDIVQKHQFPIRHISPTHVGRTESLFQQAMEFARLGGIIDLTTGASQYTEPWKSVMEAKEKGISLDQISFSSDGHAGLSKKTENGIRFVKAPVSENLSQFRKLVLEGRLDLAEALKVVTSTPAKNLSLPNKGCVQVGADADFCLFDDQLNLTDVVAKGRVMMQDGEMIVKGIFE
jgi:beta-aspartyl-dipeptidase (metallo-type)